MILNQSVGDMNEIQLEEVQKLAAKVIGVAPEMKPFISSSESNSMPFAFNVSSRMDINSTALAKIQNNAKIPTQGFYNKTKKLTTEIIDILIKRGEQRQGRTLSEIYDNMAIVWGTITIIRMLTKHATRELKLFEGSINKWKIFHYQKMADLIATFRKSIPMELKDLKEWESSKEKEVRKIIEGYVTDFSSAFPTDQNSDRNNMIKQAIPDIEAKLISYFKELQIEIAARRSRMELEQSKNRGHESICKVAR